VRKAARKEVAIMALVRWDPFTELSNLQAQASAQINSLFNDVFGGVGASSTAPSTDVYSTDKELTIETHLSGFKDKEITVQQHEGDLEIKAEHQEKEESQDRRYMLRESVSRYYRRFTLPRNADAENINAEFKDGILKVTIPYRELPQPKQVAIKALKSKNK
jgi:HSP20 family protein